MFSSRSSSLRLFVLVPLLIVAHARAGVLSGSFANVHSGSNVNLTAIGAIDWVHWGLYTESSIDRKNRVVPQISEFTLLDSSNGFAYVYQYNDNLHGYSWSDGIPNDAVNYTTTGVWAYGVPVIDSGFEISVPASTNSRMLKVFVGAFSAQGSFEATLSDGSAPPYEDNSLSTIRGVAANRVYSIQFAADSPGQALRIRWRLLVGHGADANVTLQAATLTATGANNPPVVMLTNPVNFVSFPAPATIQLGANASDSDGSVTKVEFFNGSEKIGEASTNPFNFTWNNVAKGLYVVHAVGTDDGGETSDSQALELYVYDSGGSLAASHVKPPASVNLTSEGTADWAHWSATTNVAFNHKAGVIQKISDAARLGNRPIVGYSDNFSAFSWTDGIPAATESGTTTGIYITGLTNGFLITAPADTVPRTLKVYVGCYGVQALVQAFLTDFSAPLYSDRTLSNFFGNSYLVYTFDYSAATAGQSLVVSIHSTKLFDQNFGNVTLQAATLSGGPPDPLPVTIVNSLYLPGEYVLSFATQAGFNYAVQYTDTLSPSDWHQLPVVSGTGGAVWVTNANPTASQRFYRVQTQ